MFLREQLCFSVCSIVWMIAGRSRPYILGKNELTIFRRNVLGSDQNIAKVRLGRKRFHLVEHRRVDHHHGCCCTLTPQFCGSEVRFWRPIWSCANSSDQHPIFHTSTQRYLPDCFLLWWRVSTSQQGLERGLIPYPRMIFIEFMAEMRRPMDFWKAMACAQVFISVVYMFFGLFVYSYQGQFVINVSIFPTRSPKRVVDFLCPISPRIRASPFTVYRRRRMSSVLSPVSLLLRCTGTLALKSSIKTF